MYNEYKENYHYLHKKKQDTNLTKELTCEEYDVSLFELTAKLCGGGKIQRHNT
jgi:hypothetical protein